MAAWFGLTGLMFLLTQHLWNSEAFVHGRHLATARSVVKAVKESQSSPPLHQSTGSVGVIIVDHGSKRQSANDMLLEVTAFIDRLQMMRLIVHLLPVLICRWLSGTSK